MDGGCKSVTHPSCHDVRSMSGYQSYPIIISICNEFMWGALVLVFGNVVLNDMIDQNDMNINSVVTEYFLSAICRSGLLDDR